MSRAAPADILQGGLGQAKHMNDANRDDPVQEGDTQAPRPVPEVVPAISSEQPPIAAAIGAAYVGHANDQGSEVPPAENDGETVPRDEVADQAGG